MQLQYLAIINALTQAASGVVEGLSLSKTLQRIADMVQQLVDVHYAAVGVPDDEGHGLRAFITAGIAPEHARQIDHEPLGLGLLGEILRTDHPIRLDSIQDDPRSAGFCGNHPHMTTFLGVPIIGRNNQRLGNLYLSDRRDGQPFDELDEYMVVLFASFAAIAIENAKLHQRLQAAALHGERDRISMELHDGIIQDIYAVGMKLEIIRGSAQLTSEGQTQFQAVLRNLNSIIDDIRHYIRDLSNANKTHATTFQQQVENLVQHFCDFSGIDVTLDVPDTLPALTDNQRHSLSQVLREALANIAKHADATSAKVRIYIKGRNIYLLVEDNGRGMSTDQIRDPDHYGLRNMEQRARRLRGFLEIESEIGQGTTITLVIPLK